MVKNGYMEGKVVCVTGAASGIGQALANRALGAGARVAGVDLDATGLAKWVETAGDNPGEAMALPCDVTDERACVAAVARVVDTWGGVDLLANCAGISHRSLLADTSCDVIRRVVMVNFFGAVHCTRAALPHLRERKGSIVAISSVAGFAPLIGRTGYAASKHALHGFFDTLRAELRGAGVHVMIVCPSYTDTRMHQRALAGDGRVLEREKATVGRVLTAGEVAGAILDGVRRRKRLVLVSPTARAAWWVSRIFPAVYERIMVATHRSEFPG